MTRFDDEHPALTRAVDRQEAAQVFADTAVVLDRHRREVSLPSLEDTDATWKQRIDGVMSCLDMAFYEREPGEPPALEHVAKAGAHLVAMYVAAARAQETRVESGSDA